MFSSWKLYIHDGFHTLDLLQYGRYGRTGSGVQIVSKKLQG